MTRYFFHVRDGESFTEDEEGADMPTVQVARDDAVAAATEMVAEYVRAGRVIGNQQFEVTDELGSVVAVIPFRSVIHLR